MPKSTLRVVARMVARPEAVDDVRSILEVLVVSTRAEPGCAVYELPQNRHDPTGFTLVEEWELLLAMGYNGRAQAPLGERP